MNRQIYGVALFVVIVGFSVFTYEYLNYLIGGDRVTVGHKKCARWDSRIANDWVTGIAADDSEVSVKLENVVADMRTGQVKARLKMAWPGLEEAPRAIWAQIELRNYDGSSAGWISEAVSLDRPFEKGKARTIEQTFDCDSCDDLSRNLYATVKVWTKPGAERKLLYEVTDMKPVLVQE